MTQAYTVSPFTLSEESDVPWILWEQKISVLSLQESEQTDSRYGFAPKNILNQAGETNVISAKPSIQRVQYNNVLSRMKQAAGQAGSYSEWQS